MAPGTELAGRHAAGAAAGAPPSSAASSAASSSAAGSPRSASPFSPRSPTPSPPGSPSLPPGVPTVANLFGTGPTQPFNPVNARRPDILRERASHLGTYRDLLRFEKALRENAAVYRREEHREQAVYVLLALVIAYVAWSVVGFSKSMTFLRIAFLVLLCGAVYSCIKRALALRSRYAKRCNRALRPFNMHFDRDARGEITFYKRVPQYFQDNFDNARKHFGTGNWGQKRKEGSSAAEYRNPGSLGPDDHRA